MNWLMTQLNNLTDEETEVQRGSVVNLGFSIYRQVQKHSSGFLPWSRFKLLLSEGMLKSVLICKDCF